VAVPLALAVGLGVFALSGGFARDGATATAEPVRVPAPATPTAPGAAARLARVCGGLLAALPPTLAGKPARPVTPATDSAGAWGDPAVVLRCGVPAPSVAPEAQILAVDGVAYVTREDADADVWTTVGRDVTVEVRIPREYRGGTAQDVLTTLAAPLARSVPLASRPPPSPSPAPSSSPQPSR